MDLQCTLPIVIEIHGNAFINSWFNFSIRLHTSPRRTAQCLVSLGSKKGICNRLFHQNCISIFFNLTIISICDHNYCVDFVASDSRHSHLVVSILKEVHHPGEKHFFYLKHAISTWRLSVSLSICPQQTNSIATLCSILTKASFSKGPVGLLINYYQGRVQQKKKADFPSSGIMSGSHVKIRVIR